MSRVLALITLISLLGVFASGAATLYLLRTDPSKVVLLKTALFTKPVADRSAFTAPPRALIEQGFMTDDTERIDAWRERMIEEAHWVSVIDERALPSDPVARAKAITLLFSTNGDDSCGAPSLMANVHRLPTGKGCCSDHSEVFLALSSFLGLQARETRQTRHTHNEIYDSESKQWIWIDSQFALMARSPDGRYLSLLELRDRYIAGDQFEFEFFGTGAHEFSRHSPREGEYYSSSAEFVDLYVGLGNNVFEQDDFRARLAFLPKPVWQLLGKITGVVPGFALYSDGQSARANELRRLRLFFSTLGLLMFAGLFAYPVYSIQRRSGRRSSGGVARRV